MSSAGEAPQGLEHLLDNPDLAVALKSDQFKQFLDQVPVAIAVAELHPRERVVYANRDFEDLMGEASQKIVGQDWEIVRGVSAEADDRALSDAIGEAGDYIGMFVLQGGGAAIRVDAWSNLIENEAGEAVFRMVALVPTVRAGATGEDAFSALIEAKDLQLKELQHRVKNNLQMITALIRVEARAVTETSAGERFDRLAGRIEALGLLYRSLSEIRGDECIDLGVYLSQIASSVMKAHAVEGIHLNLQVDTWPVSVDVAMPAGLVVNELLTNALKHAFDGRTGGSITLQSLVSDGGCEVIVADDGNGLPEGAQWPRAGKLSALIVKSLTQNAKAKIEVASAPGEGMRVRIVFDQSDAAPPTA